MIFRVINYSDQEVLKNKKSIFLAGPTPRGENVESLRTKACQIIEQHGFDGLEDLLTNSIELANRIGLNEQTEILSIQKRRIMK